MNGKMKEDQQLVMAMMTREESGDAKSDQPIRPTTRSEGERSF